MRKDDIVQLIHAEPFRPFRLLITNGEWFVIRHPELIAVTNGAVHIALDGLSEEEGLGNANKIMVSLIHIVKIETLLFSQKKPVDQAPEL